MIVFILFFFFFFFQAEDGIRDLYLTGVQTCALPILRQGEAAGARGEARRRCCGHQGWCGHRGGDEGEKGPRRGCAARSEERRVGKECRSRWAAEHEKKKIEKRGHTKWMCGTWYKR